MDIGIEAAADTRLYCLPQVSAYIGADIVAGAYVCELQNEKGNVLFIDIGTNGEIVLASQGRLLCCSCAAGPALEGMNISSGMRAAEGAIEDVRITEQGIELKTIGGALGSKLRAPEHGIDYVEEHILKDYADFDRLEVTDPYKNPALAPILESAKRLKDRFPDVSMTTSVAGPISTAIAVRPVEMVLKDTRKNPEMLHKLLDLTVECSLRWFDAFYHEFGPVGTNFSDPVTCMDVISKKQFDEFSLPYIKKLIDGTEKIMGSRPGAHICGKTSPIWSDLADAGLFSFSIDNCEDLAVAKAAVGDRMRIAGNVPPVDVMKEGTIDEIIEACKECMIKCADNPAGYILNTGCQLPIGTPKANVEAFIYVARKYGKGARLGHMPKGLQEYM